MMKREALIFCTSALMTLTMFPSSVLSDDISELRFTDADWGANFISDSTRALKIIGDNRPHITPPPQNGSPEVLWEIDRLIWMQDNLRTADRVIAILEENTQTPEILFQERAILPAPVDAPALWGLVHQGYLEITTLVLQEKLRFQRVRPAALSDALDAMRGPGEAHDDLAAIIRMQPTLPATLRSFTTLRMSSPNWRPNARSLIVRWPRMLL